ncbi:hypothetical protein B0J11DRAFT_532811 [Dendryphion nanum]|uniref:Structure-specific endonuclease subunit SLX4 n=1 Tax=Dendryphion nanum TaxID=256645 RepID=A0A9P9DL23_9PLEO|nr:hypothetical protein B0J11DRAFT_532811 [Dendryphion nanum]
MATFDLVLLSSSPPTSSSAGRNAATPPSTQQRVPISAQPPLHTSARENNRIAASNALRSGSRAPSAPTGATRGFASASSLVKSHHFGIVTDEDTNDKQDAESRTKSSKAPDNIEKGIIRAKKKPIKSTTTDALEPKPKKPRTRKPKSTTDKDKVAAKARNNPDISTTSSHFNDLQPASALEHTTETEVVILRPRASKPRKPREKKPQEIPTEPAPKVVKRAKLSGEAKLSGKSTRTTNVVLENLQNGMTTPPPGAIVTSEQYTVVRENTVDSIWDVPKSPAQDDIAPIIQSLEQVPNKELGLGEAVARRRDWTPVKDTNPSGAFAESDVASEHINTVDHNPAHFTSIVSGFAFAQLPDNPTSAVSGPNRLETTVIMKRPRVELIDVPDPQPGTRNPSPVKGKAPKRKARTITDIVTEQYAVQTDTPQMDNVFQSRTTTTSIPLNDITNQPREKDLSKPAKKRRVSKSSDKSSAKPKKPTKKNAIKAAKPKMVAEKLLSPASAAHRLNRQDILFGTSSQLALDESPSLIREIQRAIRESEQEADLLPFNDSTTCGIYHTYSKRLENIEGKRKLWAASARDEDGFLLENQCDIRMPEPDRTQDFPLLMDGVCNMDDASIVNINEPQHSRSLVHLSSDLPTSPFGGASYEHTPAKEQLATNVSSEDIDDYAQPPPSNQAAASSFLDIDDFPTSAQVPRASNAIFKSNPSSTVALSPTVKRRHRASQTLDQVPSSSPKGQLGLTYLAQPSRLALPSTPKSKTKQRFLGIDEILDSEDDEALSPTPPKSARFAKTPPLPMVPATECRKHDPEPTDTIVTVYKIPTAHLQWAVIKSQVFQKITVAIRSLPRSRDPTHPTWHEKILMYDPIPLEEFTAYINSSTSVRSWKRATQKQIKAFNKERKSKSEMVLSVEDENDEVLAIEKDLETWMVQGWCQEMSICCVNLEGKGKPSARKGLY